MIEVNLLGNKRKFQIPVVLGIDINKINFIAVGIAISLVYIPGWFLQSGWEGEKSEINRELDELTAELRELTRELNASSDVQEQLDAFNQQIERLEERSDQVQEIIDRRTNPQRILETVARATPERLWFNQLRITSEDEFIVLGGAENYRSIGDFINAANRSPFFGNSIVLESSSTEEEEVGNTTVRVEEFEVRGNIISYDPF